MSTNNHLVCKVASVINSTTVVLNKGANDGIKIGDEFKIYRIGEEILDPDTQENLGKLHISIGNGRVTFVQEKISTVESCLYYTKPTKKEVYENNSPLRPWSSYFHNTQRTVYTEPEEIQKEFNNVKIGDIAEIIED